MEVLFLFSSIGFLWESYRISAVLKKIVGYNQLRLAIPVSCVNILGQRQYFEYCYLRPG